MSRGKIFIANKMKDNILYEKYHSNRKVSKKTITKHNFTYRNLVEIIDKYSGKSKKVLDIGCGVGTVDFYLESRAKSVTGIDISKKGIVTARESLKIMKLEKNIIFKQMEFPKNAPASKFDLIICSEVLEHLKNDKKAVSRIYNLLNKNGIVIASSPSQNAPLYKLGLLKGFDKKVGHIRRYTVNSFANLFRKSGFGIIEIKKKEGIFRNFLFTNFIGGLVLRIVNKEPFSDIVTFVDNITIPVFGESQLYIIAKKK